MIDVIGVPAQGLGCLDDRLARVLADADVVIGGARHLAMIDESTRAERLPWPTPLMAALPGLMDQVRGRRTVVLASGDPMVSGIGTTLVNVLGAHHVRIHPAVSSVALARARLGWSAEESVAVTVVGRDVSRVRREFSPGARIIVLTGAPGHPGELANLLVEDGYGPSTVTVLSDLGTTSESRLDGTADTWVGEHAVTAIPALHLVAIEAHLADGGRALSTSPGLPDSAYENDGQLTKRHLRASALAHLSPLPGQVLWDLGAGAGSIGIEWARAHPRNRAFSVERNPERAARIGRNAKALGVTDRVDVITGHIDEALPTLARPDAVFVGGGASPGTLEIAWSALAPQGRLVVHAVTLETEALLVSWYRRFGGELVRIGVETVGSIGEYLGYAPARAVVQWSAVKPGPADPTNHEARS